MCSAMGWMAARCCSLRSSVFWRIAKAARGVHGMILATAVRLVLVGALEDHHEPVARRLVHVAVMGSDDLEEGREIGLHELVQLLWG
jgi:hypothetical protein